MTSTGPMVARRHGGSMQISAAFGPDPRPGGNARGPGDSSVLARSWPSAPLEPADSRGPTVPRESLEPLGVASPTTGSSPLRWVEPFGPVGPLRPVQQVGPSAGLTIPVPTGFRPQGDQSERPTSAGVYDALLGGTAHRRVDRRFALAILLEWPDAPAAARVTSEFLVRAVRFAARNGVNQFLALGAGARTIDPVHEIACAVAPESQTVYVEPDPLVIARVLPDVPTDQATMVRADLARPDEVLRHPGVRARLDLTRPIVVVAVPGLPQVADDRDPREVLRGYREATPRGSLLIFSQLCDEGSARGLRGLFEQAGLPGTQRPHAQTVDLVSTWDPIEPGLVPAEEWHAPDERPRPHFGRIPVYASVGWR
ncbi:SAM-dependent methyltransferase [Frankia sp. CNm7]|uniref:SAM-dependent methyltransferase n=1 Tax=Frankia nepalensis TaxID=1836974 RepID=A0A937RCW5_9ACTN|nr:SAM-dependent methyltransferase [Frankia nepalensis]MBL7494901.1 SAM-dependent methyltransferase [Frankia nepalensis]MBL7515931.1 SAM-dependent methyltransferase [Frankia nepalensis]MBL7521037.1 SAM-dependent methyltransferase [Frankia nepalensis]MBL7626584.1 SAM-dependent methyltransferase [Frankia nepalensis]